MFDILFITHIPAFYKVNLYNELSKTLNVYVIFISSDTNEKRSTDFSSLDNINIKYSILNETEFQNRNKLLSMIKLYQLLNNLNYKKIAVGGWDLPEFWLATLMTSYHKNSLVLESTFHESKTKGFKGAIKKIFLSRISSVLASGQSHIQLLEKLDYRKKILVTCGVGIINKPKYNKKSVVYQKRFLYIGRLSKEKNLHTLINVFNGLPSYKLTIVGSGTETEKLFRLANKNISFVPPISNNEIADIYLSHDVFVLPSISEPWGLVLEEALYYGLPVIVSNRCGASELITKGVNGVLFDPLNENELWNTVTSMGTLYFNSKLVGPVVHSIFEKDIKQVKSYEFLVNE